MKRIPAACAPLLYGASLLALGLLSARNLHGTACQDVYFGFQQVQARSSMGLSLPVPVVQMCDNRMLPMLLIAFGLLSSAVWAAALACVPKRWILAAGACIALAAAMAFPYVPSSDPYAYAFYGFEAAHGATPYASSSAENGTRSAAMRTLDRFFPPGSSNRIANYGPVAVLQYQAVAAAAGDSLKDFVLLQRLFNAALTLLLAWLLTLVRADGMSRREAAWAAFHPLLLLESVAFGHGDVLMLVLLCAAFAAYRRNAIAVCTALIVLACEVRLVAALALAVLFIELNRRDIRTLVRSFGVCAATLAATAAAAIAVYGKFTLGGAPAIEAFSSPAILAFDAFGVSMRHVGQGLLTQAAMGLGLIGIALLLKRYLYLPFAALAALPIVRAWYCQWLVPLTAISGDRNVRIAAGLSAGIAIIAEYPAMTAHSDLPTWALILALQWLAPIAALVVPAIASNWREPATAIRTT